MISPAPVLLPQIILIQILIQRLLLLIADHSLPWFDHCLVIYLVTILWPCQSGEDYAKIAKKMFMDMLTKHNQTVSSLLSGHNINITIASQLKSELMMSS